MRLTADGALRKKLVWFAMTCSLVALLTTAIALGAYDWLNGRRTAYLHVSVLAGITARNSVAAAAFSDTEDANRIISALDAEPAIVAAALYDSAGVRLASFRHPDAGTSLLVPDGPPPDGEGLQAGYLRVVTPVVEAKRYGTLLIVADLSEIRARAGAYGIVLLLTTAMSALLAYMLAGWLKERIVAPVQALAAAAVRIHKSADCSIRVPKQADDEFGALTDAFNAMLARIQENEAELARATERLRIAVDSAQAGMWDWDIVNDVMIWDERQYAMFRVPPGTPVNLSVFLANVHPADRQRVQERIQARIAGTEDIFSADARICPPGFPSEVRYIVWNGKLLRDPGGKVQRAVGVTLDVTERRTAELRLIESEVRFRAVAERVPAMIWSCDKDLNRDYFNRTWLAFTGRPLDRELGSGWQDSVLQPDLERWRELVHGAAEQRDPYSLEYRIRRADGAVRWLIETGSPRFGPEGAFAGYLGSCIDITARKTTEEDLEAHVRLRTRELQAANQDLESFSYSVSHDLRGPLRAILGFGEIALEEIDGKNPAAAKEAVKRLINASQRMNVLIDAFIGMARITRADLKLEDVNLSRIAEEVIAFLRSTAPGRNVDVFIQSGVCVRGDERLLRIALENLLGNAWKFTSRTERARIEFGMERQDGERVFYVRDNGAGFDESLGHKLFHAFERLHPAAQFAGLGVGLSTVYRVIEKHDGRVWARSSPGEGATFYFTVSAESAVPV